MSQLNIDEIKDILPLRYPYLMVDRVLQLNDDSIKTLKNVTIDEPYFQGHFPDPHEAIMPGTLMVEALAQSAAILSTNQLQGESLGFLTGVDNARFRHQVIPGDQLVCQVRLLQSKKNLFRTQGKATVKDEVAVEAELLLSVKGD